jgi:putative tryptophan/tyrosine transport system substrate-binding protein
MQRREFIKLVGGAAASLPLLAARAQQAGKVYRIGFLSYRGCGASLDPNGAFRRGLREIGYIEGRNLVLECRDAPGQVDRFPDLALELVRLKIDVLVTDGTPASLAAKQVTTTTPIVMVGVADPVLSGLVASLARPGGNVTGPSLYPTLEVATKALQVTKEVVPGVSRIALLRDPTNPSHLLLDDRIVAAARALGLKPQLVDVRGAVDFQDAFAAILEQLAQALFVYPLPLAPVQIGQIVEFALNNNLPGSTFWEGYVEQGFLMFYGTRLSEQNRRAVGYVDKVLKGAEPASLPVEQPTKFDLVINLKTAKTLGLIIPPTVLAQADEVIE